MITAIIQARTGSTRLPGKVLKKILGRTLLEHLIRRVKRAKTLQAVVIATTDKAEDKAIAMIAEKNGISYFRGSEDDVLDRYYRAAKQCGASVIVRLTGDCPLLDPAIIDRAVSFYKKNHRPFDYVSNVHPPTFPDGMDVEVFSFAVLEKAWKEAKLQSEREHVTPYIYNHPDIFRIRNIKMEEDNSSLRLTVDTEEDLTLMRKIFSELYKGNKYFNLSDITALLKRNPSLALYNGHLRRNDGYVKSLKEDRIAKVAMGNGGQGGFNLRKAVIDDARFLYDLRTETSVKSASFSSRAFSFASHKKWLAKKLADEKSLIYIALVGTTSIGQVRFDKGGAGAEISVAVLEAYRGKGYGSRIVRIASERFLAESPGVKKIHAYIRPNNKASQKIFSKARFRPVGDKVVKGITCIEMVLTR